MDEPMKETLKVLIEMRDTLNRIYICFEDQYIEIQKRKYEGKVVLFEGLLTDTRKKIFPLLFDQRHLSQVEIAKEIGITQSAVSKFIGTLIENELIEQVEVDDNIVYHDTYDLLNLFLYE